MFFGFLSEVMPPEGYISPLGVYTLGWVPYVTSWIPALWSYWKIANVTEPRNPPEWLAVLLMMEILLFTCFAVVQFKQLNARQEKSNAYSELKSNSVPDIDFSLNNTQSQKGEERKNPQKVSYTAGLGLLCGAVAGTAITAVSTGGFAVTEPWVYGTSIFLMALFGWVAGKDYKFVVPGNRTQAQYYEWYYGVLSVRTPARCFCFYSFC